MLDFIVLGCGRVATDVHIRNLRTLRGARIVGLIDPDPHARVQAGALAPAALRCTSLEEFLGRGAAHAALICAPPALHLELARQCFGNGLPVYLEKPLASSLDEGLQMVSIARESGLTNMVGFNLRRRPVFKDLKEAISSGKAGEIRLVRCLFSTPPTETPWRGIPGGGVLIELACHHLDLIRFLLDRDLRSVRSLNFPTEGEFRTCSFTLELEGGLPVQCHFDLESTLENKIEVLGDRATLVADRFRNLTLNCHGRSRGLASKFKLPSAEGFRRLLDEVRQPWGDRSYLDSLSHFCECLREGRTASPDFSEGLHSLQLAQSIREARFSG